MHKNKGFTLIEILVAITVLSLLMISVYDLVDNSSRTKEQILLEDRRYIQIHSALDRFALDWSQLYTPLFHASPYDSNTARNEESIDYEDSKKKGASSQRNNSTQNIIKYEPTDLFPKITETGRLVPLIDDPKRGELIFMSTSGRRVFENSKQSRYIWVRYSLRNSTADPEDVDEKSKEAPLELVRSTIKTNIYKKEFDWEEVPQYVLLRSIKEMRFKFFNRETKKYVDSLKELNKDSETPKIIKITMTLINSSGIEETIERSYKPIWPYFDHEAAKKEKEIKDKKSKSKGRSVDK